MSKIRSIDVSTAVFAKIWSLRAEGEDSEDAILSRILGVGKRASSVLSNDSKRDRPARKIFWRDDVLFALEQLGGEAPLDEIYQEVRRIRLREGRSLPLNYKAIVRRELEYNSSDSNVFKGKFDWFRSVDGIGGGVWATHRRIEKGGPKQ